MLGTIHQFPINTVFEFADKNQQGLCPQLCGYIHPLLINCDMNTPVSERAIRNIINTNNAGVEYLNIGNGYGVYTGSNGITANYYTVTTAAQNHNTSISLHIYSIYFANKRVSIVFQMIQISLFVPSHAL